MSEQRKVPKLRFPEFTDDWEQRKCGDVMSESRISGHSGDIAKKITVKLWGKGVFKKSDVGSSNTQYFIRKEGQFIYSKLDFLNSAFGVIPKELDSYETTTDLPAFDCNGINPYFMFYRAIQPNFYYENGVIADGSRKAKRIHADVFLNMPLKLPTIEEQNKIVSFLLQLDNLITLHQRKCEVLKKLKKGLLQKMFPKDGTNIPEIRFPEFSDAWEQRELSTISSMHARIGWQNLRTSEFLDSGDYYLVTGTDFDDGRINFKTCHYVKKERFEQDKKIQIKNGSILITKDGTLGKVAFVEGLDKPATLNAGVFNVEITVDEIDNVYLFQYLKAPFLMKYVLQKATGGTIKHLNQSILANFPVWLPEYREQKAVGSYFKHLDDLITLHQRKLEVLKKLKKGLLQQMFV